MALNNKQLHIPQKSKKKQYPKKVLSLFAAVAVMLSLSACKSGETGQTVESVDEVVSDTGLVAENTATNQSFETTYEITEWSADDFKTIQCCGIDISIPCKLSDIENKFGTKLIESTTGSEIIELYYDGEYVGIVSRNESNEKYRKEDLVTFLSLNSFSIKSLTETSTKEDVQKILGPGNNIDFEYADSYFCDNMMIVFNYLNGKTSIHVAVYEEE